MKVHVGSLFLLALGTAFVPAASAATLFATYTFDNSLSATQGGVPVLTAVDPLNASGFTTATVYGNNQTVYQWTGDNTSAANEAGLSFNATGVTANDYSVQLVFEFTQNPGYRRILDVQNRSTDGGFYADPSGFLNLSTSSASLGTGFQSFPINTFADIVMVDSGGMVSAYLNGTLQFSTASTEMDINNTGNLINLFLDNNQGSYQTEYSNGQIALFQVWNGGLTAGEVATLDQNPLGSVVPEPTSWFMAVCGLGVLLAGRRVLSSRRQS